MSARPDSAVWSSEPASLGSFYEPLRQPSFRWFWIAALITLISMWMHDVATAWFMRDLTDADPFLVSLIQAAASLPIVFLSLAMGTLSDMWDRRRFLLAAQSWLFGVLVIMWVITVSGAMTPALLIVLTVGLGIGKAMLLPGLSAIIPELISRKDLPLGVGLYGMANNSARVVGPALAGAMLVVLSVAAVYASNLVLLLISTALLATWRRPPRPASEHGGFIAALQAGVLHCVRDHQYRMILSRVILFFVAASSVHALLPVLVSKPGAFGLSWGAYGLGAVSGAVLFPYLSRAFQPSNHLTIGIVCHAVFLGCLVLAPNDLLRLPILLILGVFWFQSMCAAQVGIQSALPDPMRARGMGVFTMIAMAAFGLGAPLWGAVAKATSPPPAILGATILSVTALAVTCRLRLTAYPRAASGQGPGL